MRLIQSLCAVMLLALPVPARGQLLGMAKPAAEPQDVVPTTVVDSASPRAAVLGFLTAARAGDFTKAARYLDTSAPEADERADDLARRLKAVLDSRLLLDIDRISPLAAGDSTDGLARDREQLGIIARGDSSDVPIRMARVARGVERGWVFSAATVANVDALYRDLPDHWIREHLPTPLLVNGPFDVLAWQWLALAILIPLAGFVGLLLGRPTRGLLKRLVAHTETELDDKLVASARGPIILLWSVAVSRLALGWLALPASAQLFVVEFQQALAILAVYWLVLRAIGVLQTTLPQEEWTQKHPALRSLIPLGGRIARVLVFVAALLTIISQFGYPIATILAGLGIGGIAVALGAQKSLEHFFGSVSIGVDQPFRVGDWVSIGGTEGEIEAIGLRSTRVRTIERTVLSIPNGQLAETRTENFAPRERIRMKTIVGLTYGTPAATVRKVRDDIEALLRAHPKMWQDRVVVRLFEFGTHSLNIDVFCWIETTVPDEFREIREDLMLQIMEAVQRNGASFAFPTQTVHVVRSEGAGLD